MPEEGPSPTRSSARESFAVDPLRRRPSPATLAWVARSLGHRARVVGWRRMAGGISSAVHRVSVEDATGRYQVVLRQWVDVEEEGADGNVAREVRVLSALAATGLPVPQLLAAATS